MSLDSLSVKGESHLDGDTTVGGNLTVGDSTASEPRTLTLNGVKVNGFSKEIQNSELKVSNQELLPTQNAVKTYVDNKLSTKAALEGSATQDFQAKALTVSGPLTLNKVPVSSFSTDGKLGSSDQALPTQKAVKTYVDNGLSTKAALGGDSNTDFQVNGLKVNGALTVTGNVAIGTPAPSKDAKLYVNTGGGEGHSLKLEHHGSNFIVRPEQANGDSTVIENTGGGYLLLNPNDGKVKIGDKLATCGAEKLRIIRGTSASRPTGEFSVYSLGNGNYKISFNPCFEQPPTVVVQQFGDADTRDNAIVWDVCKDHCMVKTGNNSGSGTDRDFCLIAIGW